MTPGWQRKKVCRPIFKRLHARLPAPRRVLSGSLKRMSRWPNRQAGAGGTLCAKGGHHRDQGERIAAPRLLPMGIIGSFQQASGGREFPVRVPGTLIEALQAKAIVMSDDDGLGH